MTQNGFAALGLDPKWLKNLDHLGFVEMTPIQAKALPTLLAGKDVIGHASTGTGKTATFGMALLSKIVPASALPGGLILCPTRELADQIVEELRRLARPLPNTNIITVCGGRPFRREEAALANGVDVVVGTPGRVLDHLNRETMDLSNVKTLVLDEADRMLDMGFIDEVAAIIEKTPRQRQTVLMSATMSEDVREMSAQYQTDAMLVSVVETEDAPAIEQIVYDLDGLERIDVLQRVLGHHRPESAIIFCNERAICDQVVSALRQAGHSAQTMHGGLEQRDRESVLEMFGNGSLRILVATNVAARGIDIDELDAVINYELPRDPKSYVHRIGRTGRAGGFGEAITLIDSATQRRPLTAYGADLAETPAIPATKLTPPPPPEPARMQTIAIKGGRKDKLRPGDIVGALTGEVGIPNDAIGVISVRDRMAFVAIERRYADRALEGMKKGKVKGRNFGVFFLR